jgi:4,5-dihydroxyphthalate decarboxylase
MTLKLSMTCGPYDRARALIDGSVKPDGIELAVTVNDDDVDRQRRSARGEFDACEFFTGTYIADLPVKRLGFTAIPIFVKRMFRHSYIYINKRSGIRKPSDLNGKRIGLQTWITSAALWAKGMLEDDHGVDLASIEWIAARPAYAPDWKAPAWLKLAVAPADADQFDLLAKGELDAGITTEIWAPNRHPDIEFLFPDYGARERESSHALLSHHAYFADPRQRARAESLGGAQPLRRLGGIKAQALCPAGMGTHTHDGALVSRAMGRGARRGG